MIIPLSDSDNREVLQTLLIELNELRTRIDIITRWLKIAASGPVELPSKYTGPDSLFNEALKIIQQSDFASASLLQRKLAIGYARAARLLDELEEAGYIGPAVGSKPRKVLKRVD